MLRVMLYYRRCKLCCAWCCIADVNYVARGVVLQMDDPPKKKSKLTVPYLSRLINLKVKCDLSRRQLHEVFDLYHPEEAVFLEKLLKREFRTKQVSSG